MLMPSAKRLGGCGQSFCSAAHRFRRADPRLFILAWRADRARRRLRPQSGLSAPRENRVHAAHGVRRLPASVPERRNARSTRCAAACTASSPSDAQERIRRLRQRFHPCADSDRRFQSKRLSSGCSRDDPVRRARPPASCQRCASLQVAARSWPPAAAGRSARWPSAPCRAASRRSALDAAWPATRPAATSRARLHSVSASPLQAGWPEQGRAEHIPAASLEHPQAGQQISAVDGGDVARRQRLQRLGVVPVEKMSFVALQRDRASPWSACSDSGNRRR